jgi:hypothetical protein
MTTFHPFPRLPLELREQIWKDTVEPRTVDVRRVRKYNQRNGHLVSSTPVPAILRSCREAKNLGLYKRVYFEVDAVTKSKGDNTTKVAIERYFKSDEQVEEGPAKGSAAEQRYVWLDLDIDMVDIGTSLFHLYEHISPAIKRLKFERENSNEFFFNTESNQLSQFVNVEEIHIVCADGFWTWSGALHDHVWPCDGERLVFIDPFDGRVARGFEFETFCRQMLKAARLEADGEAWSTGDEFSADDES